MAGRFVLKEFASGMSRSTSRLSAHASAPATATAPIIPARASGARYLSTFPCSREAAKTGMPDHVGGVKPCSSCASNKLQLTDWPARVKAWWAHKEQKSPDLVDSPLPNLFLMAALATVCLVPFPTDGKSSKKAPVVHCSGCCYCLSDRSES